ncbi:MAG: flagellin [Planctomycetota bacterium]
MASFPASIARVPNLLMSRLQLSNLQRTNVALFDVQTELATGRAINRPSDDIVKAASIGVLDERLERAEQQLSNLDTAQRQLDLLDQGLGEVSDLILAAKNLASEQSNFGTSAGERASQAVVVDSMIRQLFNLVNRDSVSGFLFGGATPGAQPLNELGAGVVFGGEGNELLTDLGAADTVPITLGADNTLGGLVARFEGLVELVPELTRDTRLSDLLGARRIGVEQGEVLLSINGGASVRVDLSQADTAGDVEDIIERAIRDQEAALGAPVLGPNGVGIGADGFTLDVAAGATVRITDVLGGFTAQDLGLSAEPAFDFDAGNGQGLDVAPALTELSGLPDLGAPLGSIRIKNAGRVAQIDLSNAQTVQDVRNAIAGAGLGVDVEIDRENRRLILVNEYAGTTAESLSVEEVPGGGETASLLGIRTFDLSTPIERFNAGRGVEIAPQRPDPITGLPSFEFSRDLTFTLGDGFAFSVDLRDEDMVNVQTLVARINDQANDALTAAGRPTTQFSAGIEADGANGLVFTQDPAFAGQLEVTRENNSPAFDDLGFDRAAYDAATGTLRTEDTARVRVENVFTFLYDLKAALLVNDTDGIALAGGGLEGEVDQVAQTRALVGGLAQQTRAAVRLQEDRIVLDEQTRSELRDSDFAEAASRFSLLQTQLEAGYQVTAQQNAQSLLDFLG